MNNRRKGNRAVRKAIDILKLEGYRVSKVEATYKYAREKDAFGLFDIIAICQEGPVKFIQITNSAPHTHKPYDEFAEAYPHIAVEQWVWISHKGFKKYIY